MWLNFSGIVVNDYCKTFETVSRIYLFFYCNRIILLKRALRHCWCIAGLSSGLILRSGFARQVSNFLPLPKEMPVGGLPALNCPYVGVNECAIVHPLQKIQHTLLMRWTALKIPEYSFNHQSTIALLCGCVVIQVNSRDKACLWGYRVILLHWPSNLSIGPVMSATQQVMKYTWYSVSR